MRCPRPMGGSRRQFLRRAGGGFGALALAHLMAEEGALTGRAHFAGRAKRVIYLFMHGGPSHVDLWDPKPDLIKYSGVPSGDTNGWDAHEDVLKNHAHHCLAIDQPVAGLLRDLKSRGLLDDTLVIWGGEFGRMPMSEQKLGRDHNPWGYSVVLAGGGVRGGMTYGATDAIGLRAVDNTVHVHDLHATILHLLGIHHEHLTFRHHGRDERLTDVAGKVVTSILA
ncbi:MAG: DUF1501 domain-containing protein [Verrucomicrobiales bacterium]